MALFFFDTHVEFKRNYLTTLGPGPGNRPGPGKRAEACVGHHFGGSCDFYYVIRLKSA